VKYYCIVEVDTTDPSWVPGYVQNVTKLVEARGGRYLARTSALEKIEGERALPKLLVILEWPSKESAVAFYASNEYRPYLAGRLAGAKNEFLLAAGEDIAGVAQIAG
jgi:uncharacterized protein (DUF1330 family)